TSLPPPARPPPITTAASRESGPTIISRPRRSSGGHSSPWARSRNSTAFRTLRRGNQFEQLLGIVQPLSEFFLVAAKRCGGNLRGHARVFQPRIGGHEVNLIDVDSLRARESGFQLQGKLGGFGSAGGKSAHESANLFFRD